MCWQARLESGSAVILTIQARDNEDRKQRELRSEVKNDFRDRFLTEVAQVKRPASRWKNKAELRIGQGRTNQPFGECLSTFLSGAFYSVSCGMPTTTPSAFLQPVSKSTHAPFLG